MSFLEHLTTRFLGEEIEHTGARIGTEQGAKVSKGSRLGKQMRIAEARAQLMKSLGENREEEEVFHDAEDAIGFTQANARLTAEQAKEATRSTLRSGLESIGITKERVKAADEVVQSARPSNLYHANKEILDQAAEAPVHTAVNVAAEQIGKRLSTKQKLIGGALLAGGTAAYMDPDDTRDGIKKGLKSTIQGVESAASYVGSKVKTSIGNKQ